MSCATAALRTSLRQTWRVLPVCQQAATLRALPVRQHCLASLNATPSLRVELPADIYISYIGEQLPGLAIPAGKQAPEIHRGIVEDPCSPALILPLIFGVPGGDSLEGGEPWELPGAQHPEGGEPAPLECKQWLHRIIKSQREAIKHVENASQADCGPRKKHWRWYRDRRIKMRKKQRCI